MRNRGSLLLLLLAAVMQDLRVPSEDERVREDVGLRGSERALQAPVQGMRAAAVRAVSGVRERLEARGEG